MDKQIMWLSIGLGSILGGLIPMLWGASMFSLSSTLFSGLGAIAGIWFAFRITH